MLFNSIDFLIFFPLVIIIYFILPHKYRWLFLLISSCYFYMFFIPIYILILFFTIIIDYFAGILIENSEGKRKRIYLTMSILANVGVLSFFKYYNFFVNNVTSLASLIGSTNPIKPLSIILPLGLSFHTFQSMSYTIEVFKGRQKAERHLGILAVYVMFFPQLVAGPIERPYQLLHQFYEKHKFNYDNVINGLWLMMWGMFLKVVIADRISVLVDTVYSNPTHFTSIPLLVATILFSIQIYCDFSGYSNIAIGAALVMGFNLMENFNRPYFSQSIPEFWQRWHISLSSWFKDYMYVPLGGNRVSKLRWHFNILGTFLISGLWHGSNWTFILWGFLNGLYYIFSVWVNKFKAIFGQKMGAEKVPRFRQTISIVIVFTLITISWVFFRANNMHDAFYIITHLIPTHNLSANGIEDMKHIFDLGLNKAELSIALFGIFIMLLYELRQRQAYITVALLNKPWQLRWMLYTILFLLIFFLGKFDNQQFIYFQF